MSPNAPNVVSPICVTVFSVLDICVMGGGGHEAFGYDVKDKRLVVNSTEAQLVQRVFNYYMVEPSTNEVSKRLKAEGHRTKARVKKDWTHVGARFFTKQAVRNMLCNTIYIGQISSKNAKFKPDMPGGYLEDFSRVFEQIPLEKKRRLKYALFSGKVSYIKRGEDKGEIEIKVHGDDNRRTCMDSERLQAELGLTDVDMQSLFERGLACPRLQ